MRIVCLVHLHREIEEPYRRQKLLGSAGDVGFRCNGRGRLHYQALDARDWQRGPARRHKNGKFLKSVHLYPGRR